MTTPHQHKMCKAHYLPRKIDAEKHCCLCHEHDGCELNQVEPCSHETCDNRKRRTLYNRNSCCYCKPHNNCNLVRPTNSLAAEQNDEKLRNLEQRLASGEVLVEQLCPCSCHEEFTYLTGCFSCKDHHGEGSTRLKNAEPAPSVGWEEDFKKIIMDNSKRQGTDLDLYVELKSFISAAVREAKLEGFDEAVKLVKKMYMGGHESNALKILFEKRAELEEKA